MQNIYLHILIQSLIELINLVGVVIIIGYLLGQIERWSNFFMMRAFGMKGILFTAWLGTPIHEIGHALMCFIFHHQVVKIKLLQTKSEDGTLGYVIHRFNRGSLYQMIGHFFIGIAPVFSGIGSLLLLLYLFVPDCYHLFKEYVQNQTSNQPSLSVFISANTFLLKHLFSLENLINPLFYLYLFLSICIASHIALSPQDIKGAISGLITLYIVILIGNGIAQMSHFNSRSPISFVTQYNVYLLVFSSIAILFSLFSLLMSYTFYLIRSS
ncbi:hypothetical protein [Terrilactibacillus laevilacticus]|uniref:Integral membrane protein n=1 Tax=Terrilactibacillus laevilacticus TaxID=1380157 RepID=A0ABW5PR02_9BACI|nr:hypothetical protein [Terrilactibacillus laevilacticus]